jgi:hypothetical protein
MPGGIVRLILSLTPSRCYAASLRLSLSFETNMSTAQDGGANIGAVDGSKGAGSAE